MRSRINLNVVNKNNEQVASIKWMSLARIYSHAAEVSIYCILQRKHASTIVKKRFHQNLTVCEYMRCEKFLLHLLIVLLFELASIPAHSGTNNYIFRWVITFVTVKNNIYTYCKIS